MLNSLLWPIVIGVLYAFTGMAESPLLRSNTPQGKLFLSVVPWLFLTSCCVTVWMQLTREARVPGKDKAQHPPRA